MLKIGLTGGIGCGKTTVARLFDAKGVPILDADQIARELVEPGQPALAAIVEAFGAEALVDGRLNREYLRDQIFRSSSAKQRLEAILHPLVYEKMQVLAASLDSPYCIFAIPLLLETQHQAYVDRILVIDCEPVRQIERVRRRDGLDEDSIKRIMASQASPEVRRAAADDLIVNDNEKDLCEQIEELHLKYLAIAAATPVP